MTMLTEKFWSMLPPTRLLPHEPDEILSAEEMYRRRVTAISAFGCLVALGFIIIQFAWFGPRLSTFATGAAGLLAGALSAYGLWMGLWSDLHEKTLRFIFVTLSVLVWWEVFRSGGITGYNAVLLPVFPVLAAFMMRARDAILFTGLHLAVIVVIASLDSSNGLIPSLNAQRGPEFAVTVALLMAAVAACSGSALYMAYQNQHVQGQLRDLLIHQAYLAVHDYLSGLGNRVRLQQRFAELHQDDEFDILLIDLDGFKAINDTYGHEAGDHLIKTVARRMSDVTEETDLLVRLGGDEFVILLEKVDAELEDVGKFGEHVIDILSRPYPWNGEILRISASIGHTRFPLHADSPSQALGLADKALYKAKEAGKGRCITHGDRPKKRQQPAPARRRRKRAFNLPSKPHSRVL